MRKAMLLAAMVAMVLAAAAPVLAQDAGADDDSEASTTTSVQYVDCSQVQVAIADQGQYGAAGAVADDESVAIADIAQELGISQSQVNACLGTITINGPAPSPAPAPEPPSSPTPASGPSPAVEGELPETGGAPLLALGAGALLVAGGLAARRIVR